MKTKITLKAIAFCIIAYNAALLSSCSTSSQLASQDPRYHLNFVKADPHSLPAADKTKIDNTVADVSPIVDHGSPVAYQPDNQIKELNTLLKTDMKLLAKETKKSNPQIYKQIKTLNLSKTLHQLASNNSNDSGNNTLSATKINDVGGHSYLGLWITFLIIAFVFFIFTLFIPILYIFGVISLLASVIFFILWIVSLA